jgi:hypothetical protein
MAGNGSPKGVKQRLGCPNKVKMDVEAKLSAMDCNPIEGMARIARMAETAFADNLKELNDGVEVQIPGLYKDLALAGSMYKELAQYVAPKRKAIEHTGPDGGPIQQSISKIELVAPNVNIPS